jgi:DNA-binding Xre family transcriptional regulator
MGLNAIDRTRLLYGPYHPPRVKRDQTLRCVIRGKVRVAGFGDGRIPWPFAANVNNGGRGPGVYIVCGDLVRALRRESALAIQHWWGVGTTTISHWRRALGVEAYNEGTLRLWSDWRRVKLPHGGAGPLLVLSPTKLRTRRLALGLSARTVAARAGWSSPNIYGQLEWGRRKRATKATLTKVAAALECQVRDLIDGA